MYEFTGTFTPQQTDRPALMVFDWWGYTPLEPISSAVKAADEKQVPKMSAGAAFKAVKGLGT